MEKKEMIKIAMIAMDKNMGYETLYYSDYMHNKEDLTDDVWEYVIQAKNKGMEWFVKEYSDEING